MPGMSTGLSRRGFEWRDDRLCGITVAEIYRSIPGVRLYWVLEKFFFRDGHGMRIGSVLVNKFAVVISEAEWDLFLEFVGSG